MVSWEKLTFNTIILKAVDDGLKTFISLLFWFLFIFNMMKNELETAGELLLLQQAKQLTNITMTLTIERIIFFKKW